MVLPRCCASLPVAWPTTTTSPSSRRASSTLSSVALGLPAGGSTSIEKTLLDQGLHTSWATVRDTLKTHQICTIVLPTNAASCLRIRKAATPEPDVQEIYQRLAIPAQIIKPQHTWG
jgi:hypothetical protein